MKIKNIIKIIIFLVLIIFIGYLVKKDFDKSNIPEENNNEEIKFIDEKSIVKTINNEDCKFTIRIYKQYDKLLYELYENDNLITNSNETFDIGDENSQIEELLNSFENNSHIINTNENDYIVFTIHENGSNNYSYDKLFIIFNYKLLGKLSFDLSSTIGSLEGESKDLYYISDNNYSYYLIENDKIRYLKSDTCDNLIELDKINYIENILLIVDDEISIEKRSTHTAGNFSGGVSCDNMIEYLY